MKRWFPSSVVIVAGFFCALAGCGGSPDWTPSARRDRQRAIRPSPPSPAVPPTAPIAASEPATTKPAVQASSLGGQTDLFRIDLVSGAESDATGPGTRQVLAHVAARPCGRVMELLFPPLASGGSQDRYYLIYQNRTAANAAAETVSLLDVSATSEPFVDGVRRLMELSARVVPPDSAEVEACAAALRRQPGGDGQRSWMAAMLSGRVEMEFRFDATAARTSFEKAEKIAQAGSIEQMMAVWAQAESRKMEGANAAYEQLCRRVVSEFTAHRQSHIFEKAEAALKPHP